MNAEQLAPKLYRAWILARGFDPEAYPWTDLDAPGRAVWIAVAHTAWATLNRSGSGEGVRS